MAERVPQPKPVFNNPKLKAVPGTWLVRCPACPKTYDTVKEAEECYQQHYDTALKEALFHWGDVLQFKGAQMIVHGEADLTGEGNLNHQILKPWNTERDPWLKEGYQVDVMSEAPSMLGSASKVGTIPRVPASPWEYISPGTIIKIATGRFSPLAIPFKVPADGNAAFWDEDGSPMQVLVYGKDKKVAFLPQRNLLDILNNQQIPQFDKGQEFEFRYMKGRYRAVVLAAQDFVTLRNEPVYSVCLFCWDSDVRYEESRIVRESDLLPLNPE